VLNSSPVFFASKLCLCLHPSFPSSVHHTSLPIRSRAASGPLFSHFTHRGLLRIFKCAGQLVAEFLSLMEPSALRCSFFKLKGSSSLLACGCISTQQPYIFIFKHTVRFNSRAVSRLHHDSGHTWQPGDLLKMVKMCQPCISHRAASWLLRSVGNSNTMEPYQCGCHIARANMAASWQSSTKTFFTLCVI